MIRAPHFLAEKPAAAALPKGVPRPWWEGRPFVAAMILMWPAVNWDALLWGTVALAVVAPIATYPFTMTLWLALDMTFRPPGRET